MKILNLYAGIGGNRKLWGNEHEITAVELNPKIAEVYKDFFPNDNVIVADAHQYLLEHMQEFDFIWASPPCPTHSKLGRLNIFLNMKRENNHPMIYPDMSLYQEIILLKHFFKGKFCVENVVAYYEPLIVPYELGHHYFWTNFVIPEYYNTDKRMLGRQANKKGEMDKRAQKLGFNLDKFKGVNKRLLIRNCAEPELGKHILDCAINSQSLFVVEEIKKEQPSLL